MKKNGMAKVILSMIIVMLFGLMLCGCGQEEELVMLDVEENSKELGLDWDNIVEHVKATELPTLYVDKDSLESDAKDFGSISFANYDMTDPAAFKKVDYQMLVSYGIITKDDGTDYDGIAYEISMFDNKSDQYYAGVYDESGKLISEEGNWFIKESKEDTVATYISEVNAAIR